MKIIIKKSQIINFLLLVSIALRLLSETTAFFSFSLLLVLCFFGPRAIILSLFFTWLFSSLNPLLAPPVPLASAFRFCTLITSFFVSFIFLKREAFVRNKSLYIICLIMFMFIFLHSIILSPLPDVSVLKSFSWSMMFILLINCWSSIDKVTYERISKDLFLIFTAIVFFSLLLINTEIGWIKNKDAFQGILVHPQTFGLIMALFGIIILTRFPLQHFPSYFYLIVAVPTIYMLVLSECRTGIFALLSSYVAAIITGSFYINSLKKYSRTILLVLFLTPVFIFLSVYLMFLINDFANIEFINNILTKSGRLNDTSTLLSSYKESRGFIIFDSINNIKENFWTGIGFGIASDYENMKVFRDAIFGIPYSAPLEKGLFYVALFEEIGFFGFLLYTIFLLVCLQSLLTSGLKSIPMFVIILLFNITESIFFSTGGINSIIILFFTLSITKQNFLIKD